MAELLLETLEGVSRAGVRGVMTVPDLLTLALDAHGGVARWRGAHAITARLSSGGFALASNTLEEFHGRILLGLEVFARHHGSGMYRQSGL